MWDLLHISREAHARPLVLDFDFPQKNRFSNSQLEKIFLFLDLFSVLLLYFCGPAFVTLAAKVGHRFDAVLY